ncbi:MAG: SDR family NAD(P)-dependent oxidoreductase [Salinivirgaceae bacterium]|jgi:3-oxoacyl-[acyl-carrier protein] reductase|nr:SDR family NAD(P)-dependent oxidoreductase [Salinivirgaceae bacterium]
MKSENKRIDVVITGVGGGIGSELLEILAQMPNAHVTAFTRKIDNLADSIKHLGNVTVRQFDFLLFNHRQLEQALSHLSKIDVLINNAGFLVNKPIGQMNALDIHQIIQVNFTGTILFTQACLPYLEKSPKAHVVNISSMAGVQGSVKFPGLAIYSAAKSAICTFTESMAQEFTDSRIHFNCIALGAVNTKMFNEAFPGHQAPQNPADIVPFIVDFAINKQSLFNGKIIPLAATTP